MEDGNNSRRLHHHGAAAEGGVASSNGLTLSLPLRSAATGEPLAAAGAAAERGGGRDDVWSQGATMTLIEAWGNRYLELNRGNLKQKHWKEVADAVNTRPGSNSKQPKTDVQCKNRLDTLKKKYKVEKNRILGGGVSKWGLFNRMDELIGPSRKNQLQLQHHLKPPNHHSPPPAAAPPLLLTAATHSTEMLVPNAGVSNYNGHQQRMNNTESPDMTESWVNDRRQQQTEHGVALKEVASAIVKFGEVYERIEVLKQQQMMDLEKQRMEFIKDLELQRMHLFMQTQLELAKIKHGKQENSTEHYFSLSMVSAGPHLAERMLSNGLTLKTLIQTMIYLNFCTTILSWRRFIVKYLVIMNSTCNVQDCGFTGAIFCERLFMKIGSSLYYTC